MVQYDPLASVRPILSLTKTTRHDVYKEIDPAEIQLPSKYVVAVIGANQGIGAHIALAFAKAGVGTIYITARSVATLKQTADAIHTINPNVVVYSAVADLTDASSLTALATQISSTSHRLDVLAPSGGVAQLPVGNNVGETDPTIYSSVTMTNYLGTQAAFHAFLPLLLSSTDGPQAFFPLGSNAASLLESWYGQAEYGISKLAQMRLVQYIDMQYASQGIFAASVHPGAVRTAMSDPLDEEVQKLMIDSVDLAGSFLVWLVKSKDRKDWLGGRLLNAIWDVTELEAKREDIVARDLLKIKITA